MSTSLSSLSLKCVICFASLAPFASEYSADGLPTVVAVNTMPPFLSTSNAPTVTSSVSCVILPSSVTLYSRLCPGASALKYIDFESAAHLYPSAQLSKASVSTFFSLLALS